MKTRFCDVSINTDLDAVLFTAGGVAYHIHGDPRQGRPIYYGVKIHGRQTRPADLSGPFSGDIIRDRLQAAFAQTGGLDVAGILKRAGLGWPKGWTEIEGGAEVAELAARGDLAGALDGLTD